MNTYREISLRICPYCKETLNVNGNTMANHIRWCKKNPEYSGIREETIKKIRDSWIKKHNDLFKTYTIKCECCGKEFEVNCSVRDYKNKKYRKTCSNYCAHQLSTIKGRDVVIKTWESKLNSTRIERLTRYCKCCGKEFTVEHSYSKRKFCSDDCCRRYRFDKFSKNKTEKEIYSRLCQFRFALNEFPDEFNFELIKKQGWYKAKNRGDNLHGISRDHIVSIKYGFEHNIDPYIISHPANCQLLIHTDNESKSSKCDITIEELKDKILKWSQKYGEYPNKITYIDRYKFCAK